MTDWKQRVLDIRGSGLTYAKIGEKVGLATSSVGDIASGRTKRPRGDAALRLDALHRLRVSHLAPANDGEAA